MALVLHVFSGVGGWNLLGSLVSPTVDWGGRWKRMVLQVQVICTQ
jgi:hypothetical protein